MQIKFYCNLYISEDFQTQKEKIIRKLRNNRVQPQVYVIALPSGSQNHLEFYSSMLLKQRAFQKMPLFVVGVANGYEDALYITQEIVEKVYMETKDTNIREYIESKQEEFEKERR